MSGAEAPGEGVNDKLFALAGATGLQGGATYVAQRLGAKNVVFALGYVDFRAHSDGMGS